MRVLALSHISKIISGSIALPSSKSISNRALILNKVTGSSVNLQNLSEADDTVLMQQALAKGEGEIYLKNAGTCMRFLTAYFAATENSNVTLLCDERMEKRPIKELVDVLKQLGADIQYLKQEGFPPLHINGTQLNGGIVQMSAKASSQFVSALMMIAPLCKTDLIIELTGDITSEPYIEMTLAMMDNLGINIIRENSKFEISNLKSQVSNLKSQISIESDWSAASYWYEMVALSKDAELFLPGLTKQSLQGDSKIADYMAFFGVQTGDQNGGVLLKKQALPQTIPAEINLVHEPDLAPAIAVTAAATNTQVTLTGLQNLVIKESNRLNALETELNKCGFHTKATRDTLIIHPSPNPKSQIPNLKSQILTYGDHRMAMAFAPLALIFDQIAIENPDVVEKSYPHYWEDLSNSGFDLNPLNIEE